MALLPDQALVSQPKGARVQSSLVRKLPICVQSDTTAATSDHYLAIPNHIPPCIPSRPPQLFLGDTNRTISETPMNQASSRSHCIFTVYIEARKPGEALVRRSKLNLVDLAGSERVNKTGIEGKELKEAKYINLSLHYLEQARAEHSQQSEMPCEGVAMRRNVTQCNAMRFLHATPCSGMQLMHAHACAFCWGTIHGMRLATAWWPSDVHLATPWAPATGPLQC